MGLTPLTYGTPVPGMRNRTIALGSPIFTGEILYRGWATVLEPMSTWHRWSLTDCNFDIGDSRPVQFS